MNYSGSRSVHLTHAAFMGLVYAVLEKHEKPNLMPCVVCSWFTCLNGMRTSSMPKYDMNMINHTHTPEGALIKMIQQYYIISYPYVHIAKIL